MYDLANMYSSKTGCEIELNQNDEEEVFGLVDAWVLEERLGFRPKISLDEMIEEAFGRLRLTAKLIFSYSIPMTTETSNDFLDRRNTTGIIIIHLISNSLFLK